MGKTRDLFNKIRDTRGTLHAKMGSIKNRNDMDLTYLSRCKHKVVLFSVLMFSSKVFYFTRGLGVAKIRLT